MLQRIHWLNTTPQPLWNAQRSKLIEQQALSQPQHPSLMERAGLAIAQLACAIAPHARPGCSAAPAITAATVW